MFRKMIGAAVLGLLFCASAVLAEEIKGKVTKVDDAANKVTLKDKDDKEKEYTVDKDCKFPKVKGKDGVEKDMTLKSLAKQVERMKDKGVNVTVTTSKKDGKEVITEIKQEARKGKDKSDKTQN